MLSRVAESLFWMSRYLERAENLSRIVEVNLQLMLDLHPRDAARRRRDWSPVLECLGLHAEFRKAGHARAADAVVDFLVFDLESSFSVVSSVTHARENARAVREEISDEMWMLLNRTYLWVRSAGARREFQQNPYDFLQTLRGEITEFYGLAESTMDHGEGREFFRLGQYLERADKTTRVLDEEFHLAKDKYAPLQWTAVLRMCGARRVYQRKYLADVTPGRVAELLLLDATFPRSVRFCVSRVDAALRDLSGVAAGRYSNPAEKRCGRLLADLSFTTLDDFLKPGLHAVVDSLQLKLNHLAEAVLDLHGASLALLPPLLSGFAQQQQQQQ
jgi:uncharacterized alpha-E superfamily protein